MCRGNLCEHGKIACSAHCSRHMLSTFSIEMASHRFADRAHLLATEVHLIYLLLINGIMQNHEIQNECGDIRMLYQYE